MDEWPLMTGDFGKHVFYFNLLIKNRAKTNYLIHKRTNPISLPVSLLRSKIGYRIRELELTILENYAANFTHRGMSYIRYDERGKGMADGGSAVSSIEVKSHISRTPMHL